MKNEFLWKVEIILTAKCILSLVLLSIINVRKKISSDQRTFEKQISCYMKISIIYCRGQVQ